jgi:hypothetical protein
LLLVDSVTAPGGWPEDVGPLTLGEMLDVIVAVDSRSISIGELGLVSSVSCLELLADLVPCAGFWPGPTELRVELTPGLRLVDDGAVDEE